MFDINELFEEIDRTREDEETEKRVFAKNEFDEILSEFLCEIEGYLGDYLKERTIKSGKEILDICSEYREALKDEDIFLYYEAYGKFLIKEFDEALIYLNEAISKNNKAYEYYLLRGKIYEEQKKVNEAIEEYLKSNELNGNNNETLKRLGFLLIGEGESLEAIEYFQRALDDDKEDHYIYSGLAGAYYELGEVLLSIENINKAIELEDKIPSYYYNRALIYRMMGEFQKSVEDYKKTIEIDSNYYSAYFYLGDLYIEMENLDEAKYVLEELLLIEGDNPETYVKLSQCYFEGDDYKKALEAIDKAISIDGINLGYYYKRALIYKNLGNVDKVKENYNKILELDGNSAYVYHSIGELAIAQDDYDEALEMLKKGVAIEPDTVSFYTNIGICYYNKKEFEEALIYFDKAIEMAVEDNAEDFFYRGKCKYYLNLDDLGESDFLTASSLEEDSTGAMYYLAYIYFSEARYDESIEMLKKYLELEGEELLPLKLLGNCYIELEKFKDAREVLFHCLKLTDDKAGIYNDIGLSYYREGDYEEALNSYNKSIELVENYGTAYGNRALVYESLSLYDEALSDYKKALEYKEEKGYYYGIADIYEKLKQYDEAINIYEKIIESYGESAQVLGEIGWAEYMKHNFKEAEEYYKKAIEMNEDNRAYIYGRLGKVYIAKEEYNEAIKIIEKFLEIISDVEKEETSYYDVIGDMAIAYNNLGMNKEAIECIKICEKSNAFKGWAYEYLGDIFKELGEEDKSIYYYEKAIREGDLTEEHSNEIIEKLKK